MSGVTALVHTRPNTSSPRGAAGNGGTGARTAQMPGRISVWIPAARFCAKQIWGRGWGSGLGGGQGLGATAGAGGWGVRHCRREVAGAEEE